MSQITRCPSCSTTFKVVADQLRISEGWVRCGQCKEVFDASAHLLAAPPPPLLPDVSLTDVRPPPSPVVRTVDAGRPWGTPPPPSPAGGPSVDARRPLATERAAFPLPSAIPFDAADEPLGAHAPAETVPEHSVVLNVPQPAVPAFLAVAPGPIPPDDLLQLDRAAPFSWRPRSPAAAPESGGLVSDAGGAASSPTEDFSDVAKRSAPVKVALQDGLPTPLPLLPAGYELPSAPLQDAEEVQPESHAPPELNPMGYPALELPARPTGLPVESQKSEPESKPPPRLGAQDVGLSLPSVDFAPPPPSTPEPGSTPEPVVLALQEDRSPAAVLQASLRRPSSSPGQLDADEEGEVPDLGGEVSFVVAARRKAFWRKPAVRGVLFVLILVSLVALALQVAVQERDRLAAMDARARPWLLALCAPLKCDIAPQRQIADVVIDSSSFTKARGDSYQLALTMKSKASIPLAMPAVELTLTDAQDQPVLRRVLLPNDMGAPMVLTARGEWSASVAVIVTTGGARVAGYRLLAFYP